MNVEPGGFALAFLVVVRQAVGARDPLPPSHKNHVPFRDYVAAVLVNPDVVRRYLGVVVPYKHVAVGDNPSVGRGGEGVRRNFDRDIHDHWRCEIKLILVPFRGVRG